MSRNDDDFWEYVMYNETSKGDNVNSSLGCSGEIFKFVVGAVVVIFLRCWEVWGENKVWKIYGLME